MSEFDTWWDSLPKLIPTNPKDVARLAWDARLAAFTSPEAVERALAAYWELKPGGFGPFQQHAMRAALTAAAEGER